MAKMLARELAQWHVRVNAICCCAIKTEIDQNTERRDLDNVNVPREYPAGKVPLTRGEPGSADDVAQLALFLAADDARHIRGTEVWIDRKSPPQAVGLEPRR